MENGCQHDRKRSVVIFGLSDSECRLPMAVLSIRCHKCGQPFEFVGLIEGPGVTLSADRRELRLVITESTSVC
jgi:hypothetical protein